MAKQYPALDTALRDFIERQHMFFTATATAESRVNVSPRGMAFFRILDENTALYLDRTGSGAETAAHLKADGRMTIMFCAVEGPPRILRLYGRGETLRRGSAEYDELLERLFGGEEPLGARQMVRLRFDLVQTSCGYGVPLYDYKAERDSMRRWAENKGPDGLERWWREQNAESIDGLPTGLVE